MSKIEISVIIPCFNSGSTINTTINSLLNQENVSRDSFEIIAVDDGSNDSTLVKLNEIFKLNKFPNFTLIRNTENKGVSFSRNRGLRVAKGKWILFLDSDDTLNSSALANILKNHGDLLDLMTFGYYLKDNNNIRDYSNQIYSNHFFKGNELLKLFLSKKINLHISSIAYRKQFLLKNDIKFLVGQKVAEDLEFIITCLSRCNLSHYNEYHFFTYRITDFSAMHGYKEYTTNMAMGVINLSNFLKSIQSSQILKYCNFYIANFYLYNIYLLVKSQKYENKAVSILLQNRNLLKVDISPVNWKRYIILKIMRLLPVKLFLRYFVWRHKK